MLFHFVVVFDEDDTQRYHLSGQTSKDTEEWVEKIRNARYCVHSGGGVEL